MDGIFSTFIPNSGSKTRLRLTAAVLSAAALLPAVGWLLWSSGQVQTQSNEPTVSCAATMKTGHPATQDDLALTGLAMPSGVTISPEFQTDTNSYAITAPHAVQRLTFACRFKPTYHDYLNDGFGILAAGTKADLGDNCISTAVLRLAC